MNIVDMKYVGILSTRIAGYTVKNRMPYRANLRCPVCGDSKKSQRKMRGWILEKNNSALYYCHNCGASLSLQNFLKYVDPSLAKDHVTDYFLEKTRSEKTEVKEEVKTKKPKFEKSPIKLLKKISQLKVGHGARDYVLRRKIPSKEHYRLYYAPKFNRWVNSFLPGKIQAEKDNPRLVLPFFDENGNLFGFQGRAFDNDSLRYITIMLDEDMPKVFGLDLVDFDKRFFIVEGPIDSLFLSNSVAMAGADGNSLKCTKNGIYVFDNEPRNKQIVDRMKKCLDRGDRVCVWPNYLLERGKDINDLVMSGMTGANIELIIDQNSFNGLTGMIKLAEWSKV